MQDHGPSQNQLPAGEAPKPPYGPVSPVTEILEYYRSHDLPSRFDRALLRRLELAPNNESKVLNTLHWLGFTDDSGQPTTIFRRLQASDTEEFERVLKERIRAAYADLFAQMDPSSATFDDIFRYFARHYKLSLGESMARLFVGLCQSAGIPMPEARRSTPLPRKAPPAPRSQAPRRQTAEPESRQFEEEPQASPEAPAIERDDLYDLYLRKLIDGLPPLVVDPNIDPQSLRLMAELRAVELDRIERLLQDLRSR